MKVDNVGGIFLSHVWQHEKIESPDEQLILANNNK